MEELVVATLRAQGCTVHSPDRGPDDGVNLLAAPGTLGFGSPRVCVQVKSQDTPLDRPTLDQLLGTMSNVSADQGLLVCWGGFKKTVKDVTAQNFFRVRPWDQDDLLDQFLAHCDRFDDDLEAAVPLKRVRAVASGDDAGGADPDSKTSAVGWLGELRVGVERARSCEPRTHETATAT